MSIQNGSPLETAEMTLGELAGQVYERMSREEQREVDRFCVQLRDALEAKRPAMHEMGPVSLRELALALIVWRMYEGRSIKQCLQAWLRDDARRTG